MCVGAGLPVGDPLAGTVLRGRATIQGGCPLQGDERALQARRGQPYAQLGFHTVGEHPLDDANACRIQNLGTATGDRTGVAHGEHDRADARLDERLRARPGVPLVVAGLQGDDRDRAAGKLGIGEGPQGGNLGVRGAHPHVRALSEGRPGDRVEDQAPDARVLPVDRAAVGDLDGARHCRVKVLTELAGIVDGHRCSPPLRCAA